MITVRFRLTLLALGVSFAVFLGRAPLAAPAHAQAGGASITTDKSVYQIGDSIRICVTVPGSGSMTITDVQGNASTVVYSGSAMNSCASGTITPPAGQECAVLSYTTTGGSGRTQTCWQDMASGLPAPIPQPVPVPQPPVAAPIGNPTISSDKNTYQIGDTIQLCWTVPGTGQVTILDLQSGNSKPIYSGPASNSCGTATITPPTGQECASILYQASTGGSSSAQTCWQDVNGSAPPPPAPCSITSYFAGQCSSPASGCAQVTNQQGVQQTLCIGTTTCPSATPVVVQTSPAGVLPLSVICQVQQAPPPPRLPTCSPGISSVSPLSTQQSQTITIAGSCFGSQGPYNGDSPSIEIEDTTANWRAGWSNDPNGANGVTLNITSWTDNQIVVNGFTGSWGQANGLTGSGSYVLSPGDAVAVRVWNAQSGNGPATYSTAVEGQSAGSGSGGNSGTGMDATLCGPGTSVSATLQLGAGATTTVTVGQTVFCARTYSPGPNCQPVNESFDFGDGSQPTVSSQFQGASHIYNQPGVYTVVDSITSCPPAANASVTVVSSTSGSPQLGGLDLNSYCQATYGSGYSATALDNSNWACTTSGGGSGLNIGAFFPIDMNSACQSQYNRTDVYAQQSNPNDPNTWACYQGVRLSVPFQSEFASAPGDNVDGANNCGPASVAMVIGAFGGSISVGDAAVAIRGSNTPSNGPTNFISDGGGTGTAAVNLLGQYGLTTKRIYNDSQIQQELAAGHPVIILVSNRAYRSLRPYANDNDGWFVPNHIVVGL